MCSQLRDIIEHYDAFADWPWCLCYRELLNEYGSNAKFILTRRQSPEVWLKSVLSSSLFANMAEVRRQVYGFEMPHGHEAFLLDHYNRHIECVHTFFDQ